MRSPVDVVLEADTSFQVPTSLSFVICGKVPAHYKTKSIRRFEKPPTELPRRGEGAQDLTARSRLPLLPSVDSKQGLGCRVCPIRKAKWESQTNRRPGIWTPNAGAYHLVPKRIIEPRRTCWSGWVANSRFTVIPIRPL